MPLFRCQNQKCSTDPHGRLIFDFESNEPVCPNCKADARLPEFKHTVIKLTTIHLHLKDPKGQDIGQGSRYRVACGGSLAGRHGSGDAIAVNCPECKATKEYKGIMAANEWGVIPEGNPEIVGMDMEKGSFEVKEPAKSA
jgi:hypothetical protein